VAVGVAVTLLVAAELAVAVVAARVGTLKQSVQYQRLIVMLLRLARAVLGLPIRGITAITLLFKQLLPQSVEAVVVVMLMRQTELDRLAARAAVAV
jgi:dephospho-CoA kinase